jgi:hypothetical protein
MCGIACVLLVALWIRSFKISDVLVIRLSDANVLMMQTFRGRYVIGALPLPEKSVPPLRESLQQETWDLFGREFWPDYLDIQTNRIKRTSLEYWTVSATSIAKGSLGWEIFETTRRYEVPLWLLLLLFPSTVALSSSKRFSLRTLLIATAVVAAVLGLSVWSSR